MKDNKKSKNDRFIVYIKEFDRYNDKNESLCRNINCKNNVSRPFRKYCSRKCNREFTKWYYANFYWSKVRNSVLKRDNFTCQICEIKLHKKKRYNKLQKNWLECDHIVPKSYYYKFGYRFDSLENKIKTVIEFLHNRDNLRTLCYKCHREVTTKNIKQNRSILTRKES
ncbi:MAG: HNH endonuclease [Candidatus Nitrosocosmicus sp.]